MTKHIIKATLVGTTAAAALLVLAAILWLILLPWPPLPTRRCLPGHRLQPPRWESNSCTAVSNTHYYSDIVAAAEAVPSKPHSHGSQNDSAQGRLPEHGAKILLGWTPMYASGTWWSLASDSDYQRELAGTDCIFTTDRSYLKSADLVVFHGCFQPHDTFAYPDFRRPSQRWVYLTSEAPTSRYCTNQFLPANGVFNLTATYKRDSDVVLSYSPGFVDRSGAPTVSRTVPSHKTKMAFWYMNDCTSDWSSRRSDYVRELKRHVPVDVFSQCRDGNLDPVAPSCFKSSDASMDGCFLQQSRQYKFYLAFENAICRDYITEKLFKVLRSESDVVPIALGATVSEYEAVAPPESFLHVDNFSSPQHLAAYLHYLDTNDEAYMAYHRWRERFIMRPMRGRNSIDQHPPDQLRQLCNVAHSPPTPRVWNDLVTWFSVKTNCAVVDDVCEAYGIGD